MPSSKTMPSLERKPGKADNWVEKKGGLPSYIERIAKHIHYEGGKSISHAIASAVNTVKRWAAGGTTKEKGGGKVSAATQAKAAKALAEWNKMKASAPYGEADLMLALEQHHESEWSMDLSRPVDEELLGLELSVARAELGLTPSVKDGTMEGMNLGLSRIIAFDWDPDEHPRDLAGRFKKVVGGMKEGEAVDLPDGTRVTAQTDDKRVVRTGVQYSQKGANLSPDEAAEKALEVSAKRKHKASLGGKESTSFKKLEKKGKSGGESNALDEAYGPTGAEDYDGAARKHLKQLGYSEDDIASIEEHVEGFGKDRADYEDYRDNAEAAAADWKETVGDPDSKDSDAEAEAYKFQDAGADLAGLLSEIVEDPTADGPVKDALDAWEEAYDSGDGEKIKEAGAEIAAQIDEVHEDPVFDELDRWASLFGESTLDGESGNLEIEDEIRKVYNENYPGEDPRDIVGAERLASKAGGETIFTATHLWDTAKHDDNMEVEFPDGAKKPLEDILKGGEQGGAAVPDPEDEQALGELTGDVNPQADEEGIAVVQETAQYDVTGELDDFAKKLEAGTATGQELADIKEGVALVLQNHGDIYTLEPNVLEAYKALRAYLRNMKIENEKPE